MKKNGFTLVELSIVVVILGILALSAIPMSASLLTNARVKDTEQKLDAIENALEAFVIENGRLPCPAGLKKVTSDIDEDTGDIDEDTGFGRELGGGSSDCIDSDTSGCTLSGTLYYGAVPTRDLGLPDSAGSDGWGNKISYVVEGAFAETDGFSKTSSSAATINVQTKSGSSTPDLTTDGVYLLVSHGANGYGAFPLNSTNQINNGSSSEETLNQYSDSRSGVIFMQYYYNENFDDYVRYKTKMQIVMDIDWQDVGCANDGTYEDTSYGQVDDDGLGNCKKCYKYGRWGTEYECPSN